MIKPETPILALKNTKAPSVFQPANLLREARRQRGLDHGDVPALSLLDPDGDMVRYLKRAGEAEPINHWACYHTKMWQFQRDGLEFGVVGCAVGAPFAVLLAEQMFASGCRFLISITSSGQITPVGETPYYILIDRALRDEGTSYHYLPPSRFADADPEVLSRLAALVGAAPPAVFRGAAWTTDAPYRETEEAIAAQRDQASSRWKWRRRPFMLFLVHAGIPWRALPTSQTLWHKRQGISRRAKLTVRWTHS